MLLAKSIKFLENLSQYEYDFHYYDFHNDYDCESVLLNNNKLSINFKHEINNFNISLIFSDVEILKFEFFNVSDVKNLTIDNVYRGKGEIDGELKEFSEGRGYFYLEFYEGQRLEFWAKSVGIEK